MKRVFVLMAALLAVAGVQAQETLPAPVRALVAQGIRIRGPMPAPDGYKGYVGTYRGEPMPVYLLPDGRHAMIGSLYDAAGNDLTSDAFSEASAPKLGAADWKALADAAWIAEGAKREGRVVYVFTDTECPYCHRLWQKLQPYLASGDVQVRNVMVAVIAPKSLPRAAAILGAKNPAAALRAHEQAFGHSPVAADGPVADALHAKIMANSRLMDRMGASGTPAIVYRDAGGRVRIVTGLPDDARIARIFGPKG